MNSNLWKYRCNQLRQLKNIKQKMRGINMRDLFNLFFLSLWLVSVLFAQDEKHKNQSDKKMMPVLLVIDIQNEYLPYMSEDEKKFAMQVINGAIWFFFGKIICRSYVFITAI